MNIEWLTYRAGRRIAGLALVGGLAWTQPYRPLVVCGASMEPAYPNHSIILTRLRSGPITRGDIVVIDSKFGPIIKRVAYVEGDTVPEIKTVDVWQYAGDFGKPRTGRFWHVAFRRVPVPPGKVYVLGDNSYNSLDSRQLGLFDVSQIRRVVVFERPRLPTRWERLYARTPQATTW